VKGRGHIRQRGPTSWEIKFEAGPPDPWGKRKTRSETVRGSKKDAARALTARLNELDTGRYTEPSNQTIGEYLRDWLANTSEFAPKTLERYRQLNERQITPYLGPVLLQKLRPADIVQWHGQLLKTGSAHGRALAPRTVGHAHRLLHRGFMRAQGLGHVGIIPFNKETQPPRIEEREMQILFEVQIDDVLGRLQRANNLTKHRLYPISALALGSGARRGEICGSQWHDLDFDLATWQIRRSLEETDAGLRLKPPKNRFSRRTIRLPGYVIESLRRHRAAQAELRLALGLGAPSATDFVFSEPDGQPLSPDKLSRDWGNAIRDFRHLPPVSFHALRHTHASALIAAGLDMLTISRRLGHASPEITLRVYGHLFSNTDDAAAAAIDRVLGARQPNKPGKLQP
jgi:integrase